MLGKLKILTSMDRYLIKGKSIDDTGQSAHGQFNSRSHQSVEINLDNIPIDPW